MRKKPAKGIDIQNHFLVPPMRILSGEEAGRILKKYRIEKTQLPRMRGNDPEARMLGAKDGDVVAIERNNETVKYTSYRVVVE